MLKSEFKISNEVQEIEFENDNEVEITVIQDSEEYKILIGCYIKDAEIDILFIDVEKDYTKYIVVDVFHKEDENRMLLTTFILKEF